jgi:hypothetical protein
MFLEVTPVDFSQGPKKTLNLTQVVSLTPDNSFHTLIIVRDGQANSKLYVKEPYDAVVKLLTTEYGLVRIEA